MNILVAVDRHWAIGNKGQLLVTIPQDQKMFREETMGKVLVMGRKTLESFPGGQPLYGRTNIVLTADQDYRANGAIICHSIEAVFQELERYPSGDVFIIGGQSIYEQFLPYCDVAHVTSLDFAFSADTYFPNLDEAPEWEVVAESEEHTYFDLCYQFKMYKKI